MKKILYLTSYSLNADHAFKHALYLARQIDAEITLAHIPQNLIWEYEKQEIDGALSINGFNDFVKLSEMNELQKLREFAKYYMEDEDEDIALDYFVKKGDRLLEISQLIADHPFELVIMGSTGNIFYPKKPGLSPFVTSLIERSHCPLLLIPPVINTIQWNVTYYMDNHFRDKKEVERLWQWTQACGGTLHLVHISAYESQLKAAERDVANFIFDLDIETSDESISWTLLVGNVVKNLTAFCEDNDSNILSWCRHASIFWEGMYERRLIKDLGKVIKIPMLIMKEKFLY